MVKRKKLRPKVKTTEKPLNSKPLDVEKKTSLSESECSSDPNDWRPMDGPHPSD